MNIFLLFRFFLPTSEVQIDRNVRLRSYNFNGRSVLLMEECFFDHVKNCLSGDYYLSVLKIRVLLYRHICLCNFTLLMQPLKVRKTSQKQYLRSKIKGAKYF